MVPFWTKGSGVLRLWRIAE